LRTFFGYSALRIGIHQALAERLDDDAGATC
jgi:hypothetical protein